MSVKERLKEFAKYKERSVRAFETNVGLTNGYVNAIRISIQPDKIERIVSHYPDLNISWLLTGEGEMLKENQTNQQYSYPPSESLNSEGLPLNNEELSMDLFRDLVGIIKDQSNQMSSIIAINERTTAINERAIGELERSGARTDRMLDLLEARDGVSHVAQKRGA